MVRRGWHEDARHRTLPANGAGKGTDHARCVWIRDRTRPPAQDERWVSDSDLLRAVAPTPRTERTDAGRGSENETAAGLTPAAANIADSTTTRSCWASGEIEKTPGLVQFLKHLLSDPAGNRDTRSGASR
jgi:hypothetical protein